MLRRKQTVSEALITKFWIIIILPLATVTFTAWLLKTVFNLVIQISIMFNQ